MKKGIIVLLIAVLISGFAFAGDFHGSAGITFGVDLDQHEWGFANPKFGQYKFKFELDTTAVSVGADHQTDVWAELEAEASAWLGLAPGNGVDNRAANATEFHAAYKAKVTKANIHVGDIVFGILHSGTAVDYAASYYDDFDEGHPTFDYLGGESRLAPGFTVEYKGWYGGFGAEGIWDEDSSSYNIWGHGKTQSFEIADGLTAEAGGYAVLDTMVNKDRYIGGGLKVDYAQEKLSAGIGGDGALKKGSVDFGVEGSVYAQYDFSEDGNVRLDVYGVSKGYTTGDKGLKLDAMVSAAYKFQFNDDVALDVTGYVDGRNTLDKDLYITIGATEETSINAFDFFAGETFMMIFIADPDNDPLFILDLDFKVTYNHEKFKAWAEIRPQFIFDKVDETDTFSALLFNCGISSDAVIEGAVLKLVYKDVDFLHFNKEDLLGLTNRGNITASCTIPF